MAGSLPDHRAYAGIENLNDFVKRVFHFMKEIEHAYSPDHNILIVGHRCTTGCIGAYFQGIPADQNILRFSSDTGSYKTYSFAR